MRVLAVNPPIYDFTAFDFWLRPYGLLRVAGLLRNETLEAFDFLVSAKRDQWGRGQFPQIEIPKPAALFDIPRRYHRFGRPREEFRQFLRHAPPYDVVLIQTVMTYWYLGVQEVIEDVRALHPHAKLVLGGVYATICPEHARALGPDFVLEGTDLSPLWQFLNLSPSSGLPLWEGVDHHVGILKLTDGCPFRCTYCSVPQVYPKFIARPTGECLDELRHLIRLGARNIAFYDDALLHRADRVFLPFLDSVLRKGLNRIGFHPPNALNARFVTREVAELMVQAGFETFFLGFESSSYDWQRRTGGKVYEDEFTQAVARLREAGARSITTYLIIGHPEDGAQDVEASIRFACECGTRAMLSEFSPIPGTPDGERCRIWTDLAEPLNHNKTAFVMRRLGARRVQELKDSAQRARSTIRAL